MKKVIILGIIFLTIGINFTCSVTSISINKSQILSLEGNILFVGGSGPGNYTNIQEAIDDATNGDIIFVYSGIYFENIVINLSINLKGEDKNTTIIDGEMKGDGIYINSFWVNISGFTIQNCTNGIKINADKVTLKKSIIKNNVVGLYFNSADNNLVLNNIIINNGNGFYLLSGSDFNLIDNNVMISNTNWGLFLSYSYKNQIVNNIVKSNGDGGILIYPNSGQTLIENNQIISNVNYGIQIYASQQTIIKNTISSNFIGIQLYSTTNDDISENIISNNSYGIFSSGSSHHNDIFHNDFLYNSPNAVDYGENNRWDDGYPSGGNYWHDYTGEDNDGDGIGDDPYYISMGGKYDYFPFMEPYNTNNPPSAPIITGPMQGNPGEELTFTFNAEDPDSDDIRFFIDWGDDTTDETDFYPSNEEAVVSHTWTKSGKYTISAYAEDSNGLIGPEASFTVTIPRDKSVHTSPILNVLQILFKSHPNLFPVLQLLLQQLGL